MKKSELSIIYTPLSPEAFDAKVEQFGYLVDTAIDELPKRPKNMTEDELLDVGLATLMLAAMEYGSKDDAAFAVSAGRQIREALQTAISESDFVADVVRTALKSPAKLQLVQKRL